MATAGHAAAPAGPRGNARQAPAGPGTLRSVQNMAANLSNGLRAFGAAGIHEADGDVQWSAVLVPLIWLSVTEEGRLTMYTTLLTSKVVLQPFAVFADFRAHHQVSSVDELAEWLNRAALRVGAPAQLAP